MERPNPIDGAATHRTDVPIVRRLTNLIGKVPLDCECRARLDEALTRFAALESRRIAREHIAIARRQRERIEAILFFLRDLDELTADEPDRSVYAEIAQLFEDISGISKKGSEAMRSLCGSSS